jgi:uncharacterized protein (DUF2249 family)
MNIRREDRVSAVLARDESLIDVFAAMSPAFERLRNPGMRKVMARLVTIEQAARIAGISADELVRRLNRQEIAATGSEPEMNMPDDVTPEAAGMPAALAALAADRIVEVDVREDLRAGREPFSRIMKARQEVPAGGALRLRAIFEPVPLYAVMAKQGFAHHTEKLDDDDWSVWFYPAETTVAEQPTPAVAAEPGDAAGVVVLDVRDLEPPEPMVRTLAALEALPPGGTLVQVNERVPQFLLPQLTQRGYTYEVQEQQPGVVRVFIRRGAAAE